MSQHGSLPVSLPHSYTTCLFTLLTCKYLCIIIIIIIVIPLFASLEMSSKDHGLHLVAFSRRHDKICLLATLVNLDGPQ